MEDFFGLTKDVGVRVGSKVYSIEELGTLPPVGTEFHADKHLYDGQHAPLLRVTAHRWTLLQGVINSDGTERNPRFQVLVDTELVDEAESNFKTEAIK